SLFSSPFSRHTSPHPSPTQPSSDLFGNWITPDGRSTEIAAAGNSLTPIATTEIAGRKLPTSWRVALPARGLAIETTPLNPRSWKIGRAPSELQSRFYFVFRLLLYNK